MEPQMDTSAARVDTSAPVRILMVDDDPGIRDVVSDFLRRHGYQVETAADGQRDGAGAGRAGRSTWWCWT